MKLTDFAIIVTIFAFCVFTGMSVENDLLGENIYGNMMYNNIMDNIAESALQRAVRVENYQPLVKKEDILQHIVHEIAVCYMEFGNAYGKYLTDCVRLVVFTYPDGFYVAGARGMEEFQWSEKILYEKGKLTDQEQKANEIMRVCSEQYHVELLLPTGESTGTSNSLDDYQLLLVYETYPLTINGKEYKKTVFSGVKYDYKIVFS